MIVVYGDFELRLSAEKNVFVMCIYVGIHIHAEKISLGIDFGFKYNNFLTVTRHRLVSM